MRRIVLLGAMIAVGAVAGAAPPASGAPADTLRMPQPHHISYLYDGYKQTVRPIGNSFDVVHDLQRVTGTRPEAFNVDEHDQVRLPSTWWTPRVGYQAVTPEQMLAATGADDAPAPPPWTVVKAKEEGVSSGFQIVDANKVRWAIKFDPPDLPEVTTSADCIGSRLYWAAGYTVPTNVIVTFRREDLRIKPGITYADPIHGKRPIDDAYLDKLLSKVWRKTDGSWRAVASRFLPGKPIGEFDWEGRRDDDAEDRIPHDRRRELRGAWIVNAWINHDDCSSRNTIDMWVSENGRSFVRHCFIDFNGTLGAQSISKHSHRSGHEYLIDFGTAAKNLLTFGLLRPKWEHAVDPPFVGDGFIDSRTFDPVGWRPFLPNAAFDARTTRDIRWGAGIVAAFDEPMIRAAVHTGQFSDPRAEDYLVRILLERRDLIVRAWLPDRATAAR